MLSVEKCRKIIGDDGSITDVELEQMRNSLYDLARVVVESMPPPRRSCCSHGGMGGMTVTRRKPACCAEALARMADKGRITEGVRVLEVAVDVFDKNQRQCP